MNVIILPGLLEIHLVIRVVQGRRVGVVLDEVSLIPVSKLSESLYDISQEKSRTKADKDVDVSILFLFLNFSFALRLMMNQTTDYLDILQLR